jgi:alcohol dehydrogenase class IV
LKNIGIICDNKLYQNSKHIRTLIAQLEDQYEVSRKMYDYHFEPSYQYLDLMMEEMRERKFDQTLDFWIGIGGGSSIDTAKALAILCRNKGPAIQYKGVPRDLKKNFCP